MHRWFDTHCHLDDEPFHGRHAEIIERASSAGVCRVVTVGSTVASSRDAVDLASRFDTVYAAVGIQPNYCHEAILDDWHTIRRLAAQPRVVAVGETGLDRYWDFCPFAVQQEWFRRHIELAAERDLPLIIHMRDCESEMVEMLEAECSARQLRGVMHSFTGSTETAAACVEMGLHISFAGMVTYKKSDALRDVATHVPRDRLLIETDAPYLSPHPRRGQRPNEPALIVHTGQCLAELLGMDIDEMARITFRNACTLFRVPFD